MAFSSDFNLTRRASIAVVSCLWNQADIIADIEDLLFSNKFIHNHWNELEYKVLSSLKKLALPNELKLKLENLLQPMGKEVYKWMSHSRLPCQDYSRFSKPIMFRWTEKGTLDYVNTTRFVIDCCSDNMLQFHLACIFCIEDVIIKLWPDLRCALLKVINTFPFLMNGISVMFWVHYLNGNMEELMRLFEYYGDPNNNFAFGFHLKFEDKCVTSMHYFLLQISPEERRDIILLAIQTLLNCSRPRDGNVLLFLFSYLKENEVAVIVSEKTYPVLASLLDWPCTEYFMASVNSSWDNLSNFDYLNLFQDVIEYVAEYHIGDMYKKLAEQFWKHAPPTYKKYCILKSMSGSFLSRLFHRENTDDIVQMILNDCNPSERKEIIFFFESFKICDFLVCRERWSSLKLFIKSCIQSPLVLDDFMKSYKNFPFYQSEAALRTNSFFKHIEEWYNIVVDSELYVTNEHC